MNAPSLIAQDNRLRLRNAEVLAIKLFGGIECGKTSLIRAALGHCPADRRIAVISSGLEDNHAESHLVPAGCDVDEPVTPRQVQTALGRLDLQKLSLLLIECRGEIGNFDEQDLGEHARVCVCSVATGDQPAAAYASAIKRVDLVILNKIDLFSIMTFDRLQFKNAIKVHNPKAELMELSVKSGAGMQQWANWVMHRSADHGSQRR